MSDNLKKEQAAGENQVLRLENITMQFGGVVAINNLSLEVNKGEIVALIGPNGAGKTTAFNCITGVYEPTNGAVYFHGKPIAINHPTGKMAKQYAGIKIPEREAGGLFAGQNNPYGYRTHIPEHPPVQKPDGI